MSFSCQKMILQVIKAGIVPFASPKYPETFLLRAIIKSLEEDINGEFDKKQKYTISRAYKKLIADRAVVLESNGFLRLTDRGQKLLSDYELDEFTITKPKRWDGKYRVIIFDISEQKGKIRTALRRQLAIWGFVRLQNSVWVIPYECQEVVSLLKASFGVVKDVVYMTVDSIENDNWLRKEFGLP